LKKIMAIYREAEDLINIGAYVKGSSSKIDNAIKLIDEIIGFLEQQTHDKFTFEESVGMILNIIDKSSKK